MTTQAKLKTERHPFDVLKEQIRSDPEYAWAWHCNLAVPMTDVGVGRKEADQASALILSQMFDCDITTHPYWQGEKSGAQAYFEMRVAAEREEDAHLLARSPT